MHFFSWVKLTMWECVLYYFYICSIAGFPADNNKCGSAFHITMFGASFSSWQFLRLNAVYRNSARMPPPVLVVSGEEARKIIVAQQYSTIIHQNRFRVGVWVHMPRAPAAETKTAEKQQKIKARKILATWKENGHVELAAYVYMRKHESVSFLQQLLERHQLSPPPNISEFEPQHPPLPPAASSAFENSSNADCGRPAPSTIMHHHPPSPSTDPHVAAEQSTCNVAPAEVDPSENSHTVATDDLSSIVASITSYQGNDEGINAETSSLPPNNSMDVDVDSDSLSAPSNEDRNVLPCLSPSEFLRDWLLRANVSLCKVDEFLQGIHANKVVLSYKELPKTARTLLKMDNTSAFGEGQEEIVEMQGQAPKNATKAVVAQFEKSKNGNFVYYGIERCLKMQTPGMVKREKYIRLLRMINAACPGALSSELHQLAFAEELEMEEKLRNAGFQPSPMDEFANARPKTSLIVLKLHVDQVCPFKNSIQASTLPLLAAVHKVAAFDVSTKRIVEGTS